MRLLSPIENAHKPLIGQIIDLVPFQIFTNYILNSTEATKVSQYMTYNQLVALSFVQINKSYTLNDISKGKGVGYKFKAD